MPNAPPVSGKHTLAITHYPFQTLAITPWLAGYEGSCFFSKNSVPLSVHLFSASHRNKHGMDIAPFIPKIR